ncbi:MAG: hypothetical protein HGA75_02810 [Thiobacillus sp.]|nr:hypothetical protein [Thiobacillus sp.]
MKWPTWRQRTLLVVLTVTIVLSALSGDDATAPMRAVLTPVAPASERAEGARPAGQAVPRLALERLQRSGRDDSAIGKLFGAMSWYVPPPPPPPVKPPPPPPPSAPPMPFTFMGRYLDGETLTILLVKGDRIYTVSEGEVIENTYRVGRLQGGVLEMTYLPLNIKQTISAG